GSGFAPPRSSASAVLASPSCTATMSGVAPLVSGLSAHFPSLSSSDTPSASRYSTAVMRSLNFGPATDFGSNAGAAGTFGAAAMRVGAGLALGLASSTGFTSTGFTSTTGAGFAAATGTGF